MTRILLAFTLCLSFLTYSKPSQAMDAKIKVLASTSLYGASGGALLGFASMAFGTSARSIAKGASLGLYAGILFGTYIVVSHYYRPQYEAPYEDTESPYESGGSSYDKRSTTMPGPEDAPQLYEKPFELNQVKLNYKSGHQTPPMYLDLIRWEF